MSKDSFVRDALVLTLITLIAGLLLGAVYGVTKDPIEEANNASTVESYKAVMSDMDSYDADIYAEALSQALADGKIASDNAGAELLSVVAAKDASGAEIGYVVKGQCGGYGGNVIVVVGVDTDLKVTGIAFPETLPETPGLGQKATEPDWMAQFVGKGTNLKVDKDGGTGDEKVDAISGATITSRAVTNTVNAATEFVQDYIMN